VIEKWRPVLSGDRRRIVNDGQKEFPPAAPAHSANQSGFVLKGVSALELELKRTGVSDEVVNGMEDQVPSSGQVVKETRRHIFHKMSATPCRRIVAGAPAAHSCLPIRKRTSDKRPKFAQIAALHYNLRPNKAFSVCSISFFAHKARTFVAKPSS
jgi:hypothetical protein